jgi:GNAT superfamily N-acetyltransferase
VNTAEFRRARSCYHHLAGESGVGLLDALLVRGWVVRRRRDYVLTEDGHRELTRRGFAVERDMRGRGCPDLTERREHLAGPLGRALLEALLAHGRLARRGASRALVIRRRIL